MQLIATIQERMIVWWKMGLKVKKKLKIFLEIKTILFVLLADERLIKNLSEKLNEMIESKTQLHKKLVSLQKELDFYKSTTTRYTYENENEILNESQLEINDYSKDSDRNIM
jgi:hypothetical protein